MTVSDNNYVDYVILSFSNFLSGDFSQLDSSFSHRIQELTLAVTYANEYFPFGLGPSRELIASKIDTIESFYAYYILKWGYLGLLFQLVLYYLITKIILIDIIILEIIIIFKLQLFISLLFVLL